MSSGDVMPQSEWSSATSYMVYAVWRDKSWEELLALL
jgi:hypothetical protein